jgi:hypothetical protein
MAECGGSPERACATTFGFGRFRAQIKVGLRTKNREGVGWAPRENREGKERRSRLGLNFDPNSIRKLENLFFFPDLL